MVREQFTKAFMESFIYEMVSEGKHSRFFAPKSSHLNLDLSAYKYVEHFL